MSTVGVKHRHLQQLLPVIKVDMEENADDFPARSLERAVSRQCEVSTQTDDVVAERFNSSQLERVKNQAAHFRRQIESLSRCLLSATEEMGEALEEAIDLTVLPFSSHDFRSTITRSLDEPCNANIDVIFSAPHSENTATPPHPSPSAHVEMPFTLATCFESDHERAQSPSQSTEGERSEMKAFYPSPSPPTEATTANSGADVAYGDRPESDHSLDDSVCDKGQIVNAEAEHGNDPGLGDDAEGAFSCPSQTTSADLQMDTIAAVWEPINANNDMIYSVSPSVLKPHNCTAKPSRPSARVEIPFTHATCFVSDTERAQSSSQSTEGERSEMKVSYAFPSPPTEATTANSGADVAYGERPEADHSLDDSVRDKGQIVNVEPEHDNDPELQDDLERACSLPSQKASADLYVDTNTAVWEPVSSEDNMIVPRAIPNSQSHLLPTVENSATSHSPHSPRISQSLTPPTCVASHQVTSATHFVASPQQGKEPSADANNKANDELVRTINAEQSADQVDTSPIPTHSPDKNKKRAHRLTRAAKQYCRSVSPGSNKRPRLSEDDGQGALLKKRFSCQFCAYSTMQAHHLQRHIRIHTGEKPFKCPTCDFRSAQEPRLREHIRTHTGERPFQCPCCDYRAAEKRDLTRHFRSHTGLRPHKCTQCPYSSVRLVYLKNHMKAKHPVESREQKP